MTSAQSVTEFGQGNILNAEHPFTVIGVNGVDQCKRCTIATLLTLAPLMQLCIVMIHMFPHHVCGTVPHLLQGGPERLHFPC